MPIKLTSREYKIIGTIALVAGLSLVIGVKYFWKAFPEAAIEFRVTRDDSTPLAEAFLAARGYHLQGYRHAAIFAYDDDAKVFLERTQGLERMTELTRGPVHLWRWTHRWFKPQQKEEFHAEVTPSGEVVGFAHDVEEDSPGANLETPAARTIAESFLRDAMRRDLNDLEFVESESNKRRARTDHTFTWKQKSVNLGEGSLRIEVGIDGDQVASYREFVKIPDQWSRDYRTLRSRNETAQSVDQLFMVVLFAAMLILLVLRIRDRDIPPRLALGFALVGAALYFLGQLNNFSLEQFGYLTKDSYSSFLSRYFLESVLAALGVGTFIFFLVASSEPVYREAYPALQSFRRSVSWQGIRSRSFFIANVVGIGLTFFFFAYQTIFYLVANRLGAWAPVEVNYSDLLNTRIPWVWVLFIGFLPAVFEEMMFRGFAIAFLKRWVRSMPLAIVLAAFIWGFGHAAYPNQPFFIRGLEVGLGGVVIGIVMLRFGLVATMIWHYSVDALYTAFLLLRSHNSYLMVSGGITAGIMLVPLGVSLIAYLKTGTFSEEESLTNAREGISRVPRETSSAEAAAPLVYQPLAKRRLVWAALLTVVFIAIASVHVYEFGEGVELRTTRADAFRLADQYLGARHVNTASYQRVAMLQENVDAQALRYILERRTVKEADQIYRRSMSVLLWEVRYFRPLEKEEHHVFIDADAGKVCAYQHEIPEDAPGASLSMDQARDIAEKAMEQAGFAIAHFDLQDAQSERKRARQDYTFTWQAKPGDPRNVGEARFRVRVDIAGDQVVDTSQFFKIPDDWIRKREGGKFSTILLRIPFAIVIMGVVSGGLIVLVRQIRAGKILWRRAGWAGAGLAVVMLCAELNALPTIERVYATSMPLGLFRLVIGVSFLIIALVVGLGAWLLVGLVASLFPDIWRIFSGPARRTWRRDAVVAMVISLAAGAALGQVGDLLADRFHAYLPVDVGLLPRSIDSFSPAAGIFLGGLTSCVFRAALVGLIIYLVRSGIARHKAWLFPAGLIFMLSLGPADAHSVLEYVILWGLSVLSVAIAIGILVWVYRENILAYVGTGFLLAVFSPMISLLSYRARFFEMNGAILSLLVFLLMAWALSGRRQPEDAVVPEAGNSTT